MRLAALCTAALALQPSSRQLSRRAASHRSKAEADDVDADFRRLLATGLTPTDAFTPVDVAALTLRALRSGDERFLHRFSTPEFARSRAEVKLRDAFRTNPPDSLVDIYTHRHQRASNAAGRHSRASATASTLYSAKSTPPTSTTTFWCLTMRHSYECASKTRPTPTSRSGGNSDYNGAAGSRVGGTGTTFGPSSTQASAKRNGHGYAADGFMTPPATDAKG